MIAQTTQTRVTRWWHIMTRENSPSMDNSKKRNRTSRPDDDIDPSVNESDDQLSDSGNIEKRARNSSASSDRYFILSASDGSGLSSISPFILGKAIKLQAGPVADVRKLRNGTVLIKTRDDRQAAAVQGLHKIGETSVKVAAHRTLNYCKGVIKCRELIACTDEEIAEELKTQGVVQCTNISVKTEQGDRRKTNTFILTFHSTTLPSFIRVSDFLRVSVTAYVPNPLRCFKCQRFGHGQNSCSRDSVCARCATRGHTADHCSNEPKCANCAGDHPAFSRDCPVWSKEKRVQEIKVDNGVSFVEARKLVNSQSLLQRGRSFVSAASVESRPVSARKSCSVATQTDMTWPNSQPDPLLMKTFERAVQTEPLASDMPSGSGGSRPVREPAVSAGNSAMSAPLPPSAPSQRGDSSDAERQRASMRQSHRKHHSLSPPKGKVKDKGAPTLQRPPRKLGEDPIKVYNKYGVLEGGAYDNG